MALAKLKKKKRQKPDIDLCCHGVNVKFCLTCRKIVAKQLSADQQEAVRAVISGKGPFFLTGPAGSGKSFIIDHLRATVPYCEVTATTGSAAQIVKGRTLHSYASIHPTWGVVASKRANNRVRSTQLLIVDESSMADPKLLDQIFERFEQASHFPKLLMVGDFMQLPPVNGTSLFDSHVWSQFTVLKLSQQHRQSDSHFIAVLNDIRKGDLTDRAKKFIESRNTAVLPDDCTHLTAMRYMAQQRNELRLKSLPGAAGESKWAVKLVEDEEGADKIDFTKCRFVETLLLKEQARVVLLTNESEGRWVNGSTGVVDRIRSGCVSVKLDSGSVVDVVKETEELVDDNGDVVATVSQYPIMLAWSLTIHKAQGMTMDRVGVDLHGHFAPGQTYVALSRCRTAEGLFLKGHIDKLITDEKALEICG